jgi:plastocyanin
MEDPMKTLAFLAVLSVLFLGTASAVPLQDVKVEITDKGFQPQQAEVAAGQSVIWMNTSKHDHTVTARAAAAPDQDEKDKEKTKPMFDSGPIRPGASFTYKFEKAGTYNYGCSIDKSMTGVITVKEKK